MTGTTSPSCEDRLDYLLVRAARMIAAKRGEKPIAWSDLKKKLGLLGICHIVSSTQCGDWPLPRSKSAEDAGVQGAPSKLRLGGPLHIPLKITQKYSFVTS